RIDAGRLAMVVTLADVLDGLARLDSAAQRAGAAARLDVQLLAPTVLGSVDQASRAAQAVLQLAAGGAKPHPLQRGVAADAVGGRGRQDVLRAIPERLVDQLRVAVEAGVRPALDVMVSLALVVVRLHAVLVFRVGVAR